MKWISVFVLEQFYNAVNIPSRSTSTDTEIYRPNTLDYTVPVLLYESCFEGAEGDSCGLFVERSDSDPVSYAGVQMSGQNQTPPSSGTGMTFWIL